MSERRSGAALMWFRRDLRAIDNAAFRMALERHQRVHAVFVFDTEILDLLASRADRRVSFIWESVRELQGALASHGGGLHVLHGRARELIPQLATELAIDAVYANRDYEPGALARDAEVRERLRAHGRTLLTHKDQVIFELPEVRTGAGEPYSVFSPYRRAWLARLGSADIAAHDCRAGAGRLAPGPVHMPSLESLGFLQISPGIETGRAGALRRWRAFQKRLAQYAAERDFPARDATSRLSVHLRFGTLSIRELVRHVHGREQPGAQAWLSELIWREFYFALLAARPDLPEHSFRREFDQLQWDHDEHSLAAWREGRTGYPLVDAAMRELAGTGFMHNRLRMLTASFLVKDLGQDWRRGERHFAALLLDYDLAANNGGWQWSASTGCDAQPWFRIFNPVTQSRRFDPRGEYIRRWVPEVAGLSAADIHAPWELSPHEQRACGCVIGEHYPAPIVDHALARVRTLARFAALRGGATGRR